MMPDHRLIAATWLSSSPSSRGQHSEQQSDVCAARAEKRTERLDGKAAQFARCGLPARRAVAGVRARRWRLAHRQRDKQRDSEDGAGDDEERRLKPGEAGEEEHARAACRLPDRRAGEHQAIGESALLLGQRVDR